MTTQALTSKAGCARVLYYIATAEKPVTVSELAEELDTSRSNAHQALKKLWRSGFLVRRRANWYDKKGGVPHEYALNPRGAE